ncbi:MAG TPA: hypothetical protein PLY87_18415, partial [Planctomycetaceae bacterium]|nr:hypothetical protein [Planctomycetaceae bacterium]
MKKSKQAIDQFLRLPYFWEAQFGKAAFRVEKNLQLSLRCKPDADLSIFEHGGQLPWRLSHQLEGRDPDVSNDGIWGISQWRCQKRYGNIANSIVPFEQKIADIPAKIWDLARQARLFGYFRVPYSNGTIRLLQHEHEVRLGLEITTDWYDPPDGLIPALDERSAFIGSHAVPLMSYVHGRFMFRNSWGEWGHHGHGAFPLENWDKSIIDSWYMCSDSWFVLGKKDNGIVCRGWKWEPERDFGVHGREIYDAGADEYLAWAFCVVRDGYLDIDEFFVWPSERGKGYGRYLADMVLRLSFEMRRPIRQVVSFADTEPSEIEGAYAVARMLNVRLVESTVRWASMIGTANAADTPPRNWRPIRPASILEKLRPKAEPPLTDPQQYTVFFGTNRKPINHEKIDEGFTNVRGNELHLGHCLVEIPVTHSFGRTGRLFRSLFGFAESDAKAIKLTQGLSH